ncbi:hypothetical protein [Flindersiella endophytica]
MPYRRVLPLLALLGMAFLLWYGLQGAEPFLGHDESVYAAKARSWLTDLPAAQWDPRRAPGVPALGAVALTIHDSVGALRAVGLLLVLLTLAITYVVAARLTTYWRASAVVLVVLTAAPFLRRVPEFLSDIGAAGLLFACAYLVIRRRLIALAVVALATFYLRYGATAGLLAIALAALVVWGPKVWLADKRRLVLATGVFVAGLVPHFAYATWLTGRPWGLLADAGASANQVYFGDGLVFYVTNFPSGLAGVLGAVLMAIGLIAAIAGRHERWKAFLGLSAVLGIVLLGLVGHGEPRFVYFSVIALILLGADAIAGRSRVALAAVTVVALAQLPFAYLHVRDHALAAVTGDRRSLVAVAEHLRRPCVVVTSYQPEIGWYSGCGTTSFARAEQRRSIAGLTFVLFERGHDQPAERDLRELIGDRPLLAEDLPASGSLGKVRILTVGG